MTQVQARSFGTSVPTPVSLRPPSTFEVNGVQYIAVQSGYGVDPAFQQGLMAELVGWRKDVPQGGVVWVFAVTK